jgi:hypothetical protein
MQKVTVIAGFSLAAAIGELAAVHTPAIAMAATVIAAASRLHGEASLETGKAVRGDPVDVLVLATFVALADAEVAAVGVFAGEVQKVDAGEDGEEAAEERDGIYGVGSVEAAEEDEGGDEGAGGECYVVERVYAGCMGQHGRFC